MNTRGALEARRRGQSRNKWRGPWQSRENTKRVVGKERERERNLIDDCCLVPPKASSHSLAGLSPDIQLDVTGKSEKGLLILFEKERNKKAGKFFVPRTQSVRPQGPV